MLKRIPHAQKSTGPFFPHFRDSPRALLLLFRVASSQSSSQSSRPLFHAFFSIHLQSLDLQLPLDAVWALKSGGSQDSFHHIAITLFLATFWLSHLEALELLLARNQWNSFPPICIYGCDLREGIELLLYMMNVSCTKYGKMNNGNHYEMILGSVTTTLRILLPSYPCAQPKFVFPFIGVWNCGEHPEIPLAQFEAVGVWPSYVDVCIYCSRKQLFLYLKVTSAKFLAQAKCVCCTLKVERSVSILWWHQHDSMGQLYGWDMTEMDSRTY